MSRFVHAHVLALTMAFFSPPATYAQAAVPARQLGTVTAIDERALTLTTAAGTSVPMLIGRDAVVLLLPPGSKDLKSATESSFAAIAIGDRVLVSAKPGDATHVARVILMKSTAIAARNSTQQADWLRRGTGGLVRGINGPEITVTSGTHTLKVMTSADTIFRRYAGDSVRFEDAKAGTFQQIQPGDQMRVRGVLSEDRSLVTAEEVVSGSFENLSGAVTSVDAAGGTITLHDLVTKKTLTVKITANSDLRRLTPAAAATFSAKTHAGAGLADKPSMPAAGSSQAAGGTGRSAGSDLSQMMPHLPVLTLADVHPGDAVLVVASLVRGSELTAVTLLSGVEQMLSATPAGAAPITLSPWNIGAPDA